MKVREIAELVGGRVHGDPEIDIVSVADVRTAGPGQIAFISKGDSDQQTNASCVLVPLDAELSNALTFIHVDSPKLAFSRVAALLHPYKHRDPEIHETAILAEDAKVGDRVFIGAYVCVGEGSEIGDGTQLRAGAKLGDNVRIGKDCVIHPNVFVEDGCTIGDRVVLHAGVVIGADGFGYVPDENGSYIKFPQIGTVVIEDDVDIGANTCVDRGALGETRICEGTKIDNLVQVAHNVRIGKRCVIAAQTGISGSSVIEDDVVVAGQVGIADHVQIRSGAIVGAQAGIPTGKIIRKGVWWGTPAQPLDDFKRQHAHLRRIEKLKQDVDALKTKASADQEPSE
jgi:UDP-3-O-[3-hydroxymyristoyl] glucosamine N-acyltransferase